MARFSMTVCGAAVIVAGLLATGDPVHPRVAAAQETAAKADRAVIAARGVVESSDTATIASPVKSVILHIVPEGARVKKGEVVVELDDSQLRELAAVGRIKVAHAKSRQQATVAALDAAGRRDAAVERASKQALKVAELSLHVFTAKGGEYETQLRTLDAGIETLKLQRSRAAIAAEKRGLGADATRAARLEVAAVESQLVAKQAERKLLAEFTRPLETARRELKVLERKAQAVSASIERRSTQRELNAARSTIEAELAREVHALAAIERQIAQCKVKAPRDGVALYVRPATRRTASIVIEEGAAVRERQPLLQIPDLTKLQVRVMMHPSVAGRLRRGQSATLRIDAFPDRKFEGKVASKSGAGVVIAFSRKIDGLRPGLTVLAEIRADK